MLNRRRRQQTPTFLEGTPGLYVRRESPPRVPSTAPIPSKGDVTPRSARGGRQSNASRSLSGSYSSLVQGGSNAVVRKATAPLGASTPALVASNLYASAAFIATTTAIASDAYDLPQTNNFSSVQNFAHIPSLHQYQNHYKLQTVAQSYKQHHNNKNTGRNAAAPPYVGGQRRTAARHELSSHSFNNPPSTSWTATRDQYDVGGITAGAGAGPPNLSMLTLNEPALKNTSADASENGAVAKCQKNAKRRNLATSLSFGNVMESLRDINDEPLLPNGVPTTVLSRVSTNATAHFDNIPCQQSITSAGSTMIAPSKPRTTRGSSSTSLQSLPGSSILRDQSVIPASCAVPSPSITSQHHVCMGSSTCNSSGDDPEAELELPPNWEVEVTPDGIRYYVDHNHRRTHWIHPLAVENLSPGWIKIFDPAHGVVYYNELEERSQFEHPGLAAQGIHFHPYHHVSHLGLGYHHNTQLQASKILEEYPPSTVEVPVTEDLNIIDDKDVPEWIRLYSEAPFESDHLLNWKMFDVPQLEEFDQMLMKLFKQDAINTVIKYERPRREINNALMTRNVIIS